MSRPHIPCASAVRSCPLKHCGFLTGVLPACSSGGPKLAVPRLPIAERQPSVAPARAFALAVAQASHRELSGVRRDGQEWPEAAAAGVQYSVGRSIRGFDHAHLKRCDVPLTAFNS